MRGWLWGSTIVLLASVVLETSLRGPAPVMLLGAPSYSEARFLASFVLGLALVASGLSVLALRSGSPIERLRFVAASSLGALAFLIHTGRLVELALAVLLPLSMAIPYLAIVAGVFVLARVSHLAFLLGLGAVLVGGICLVREAPLHPSARRCRWCPA
jgi:hypothetical protein